MRGHVIAVIPQIAYSKVHDLAASTHFAVVR